MKHFVLAIAAVFSVVTFAHAQPGSLDERVAQEQFEETTLADAPANYFALGVGPIFTGAFLPVDDLNAVLNSGNGPISGTISSPMLMIGIEAFTGTSYLSIENMRLGFSWQSGSAEITGNTTDSLSNTTIKHKTNYQVSSNTIHLDYGILLTKQLVLLPGVGFGWTRQTLNTMSGPDAVEWNNVHPNTPGLSNFAFTELSRSSVHIQPRLNLEFAITKLVCVRAAGGFTLSISKGDWLGNGLSTVNNVPSGIQVTAPYAQLGLFFGLFNN